MAIRSDREQLLRAVAYLQGAGRSHEARAVERLLETQSAHEETTTELSVRRLAPVSFDEAGSILELNPEALRERVATGLLRRASGPNGDYLTRESVESLAVAQRGVRQLVDGLGDLTNGSGDDGADGSTLLAQMVAIRRG